MMFPVIWLTLVIGAALADVGGNEFLILSAPKSVEVNTKPTKPIRSSQLADVVDGILGLSAKTDDFITSDIWNRPEAVAVLEIVGFPNFHPKQIAKGFDLDYDGNLDFENTGERLSSIFSGQDYATMDVSNIITGHYAGTVENEAQLSPYDEQLSNIKNSLKWMKSQKKLKNGVPDLFVFHLEKPDETNEPLKDLASIVDQIQQVFKEIYGDNFVFLLVKANAADVQHIRHIRAAEAQKEVYQTAGTVNGREINLAQFYDENYPVIFNIILWFMISFGITIAGIAVWIWFMDPGKDSIIYRMTMARAKKD